MAAINEWLNWSSSREPLLGNVCRSKTYTTCTLTVHYCELFVYYLHNTSILSTQTLDTGMQLPNILGKTVYYLHTI